MCEVWKTVCVVFDLMRKKCVFYKKHLPINGEIRLFKFKISDEGKKALEYDETVVIIL